MSEVVDLNQRRQQRVMEASMHPTLRWVAGSAFYVAHRKDGTGAACGARGDLMLAPNGVPLCVKCFPLDDRVAT